MSRPVVALAGGVGAARFLEGLVQVVPPEEITAIVNTGDDRDFFGLRVCPDLDIVTYSLARLVNPETGWGFKDETFHCLEALGRLRDDTWFSLGDRDLATHIQRTARLREGASLTEVSGPRWRTRRRARGRPVSGSYGTAGARGARCAGAGRDTAHLPEQPGGLDRYDPIDTWRASVPRGAPMRRRR
jgi:hypothetical protein